MKVSHSKIYLSKSNIASVEHVRAVREHLQSLGYKVVEYVDGPYDPLPMLGCATMIMVGYDMCDGDLMEVGKGQYQQLEYRESAGFDYTSNLYFTGIYSGLFQFYEVESGSILDSDNWKKGFGELQLVEEGFLEGIAKTRSELTTRVTDPQTMEIVDRMESELPDNVFSSGPQMESTFHIACITLFKS